MSYTVTVNIKTGEIQRIGKLVLSEDQEKSALEFLVHVCETVAHEKKQSPSDIN